jgi:hypothetical protein
MIAAPVLVSLVRLEFRGATPPPSISPRVRLQLLLLLLPPPLTALTALLPLTSLPCSGTELSRPTCARETVVV